MTKKTNRLVLVLGLIAFSFTFAFAAPPPPEGVTEIIEEMAELEESFENEKWEEAAEAIGKIDKELKEVFAQSKLNDAKLEHILGDLKTSIQIKDEKHAETNYILFQRQFFTFIGNFQFEIHPVLTMIQQYVVDEASEAFAKKDYDDIVSEMREAANLIGYAKPLLVEKGIANEEVASLKAKIVETIKAGRARDDDKIGALLTEIEKIYASFMERYKAA